MTSHSENFAITETNAGLAGRAVASRCETADEVADLLAMLGILTPLREAYARERARAAAITRPESGDAAAPRRAALALLDQGICRDNPDLDEWNTPDQPAVDASARTLCGICPARTICGEEAVKDPRARGLRAGYWLDDLQERQEALGEFGYALTPQMQRNRRWWYCEHCRTRFTRPSRTAYCPDCTDNLTDAAPARDRLHTLARLGATPAHLADVLGLDQMLVERILSGRRTLISSQVAATIRATPATGAAGRISTPREADPGPAALTPPAAPTPHLSETAA